jgi:hypothetical protein
MLKIVSRMLCALVLMVCILSSSVACNQSQTAKAVNKSSAVVQIVAVLDVPAQLAVAGIKLTEEEAANISSKVNSFRDSYKVFNEKFQQGVKDGLSLIELSPLFLDELTQFNQIFNVKLSGAGANSALEKIMAGARIAINVVAAFFASGLLRARAIFQEDHSDLYVRTGFAINRLPYNGERLKTLKVAMPDKSSSSADRALCDYFNLRYEPQKIALLERYAAS